VTRALIVVFLFAACGGDSEGTAPPPKPPAAKPGDKKKPDKKIVPLAVYPKIEDRVTPGERASIRHKFRENDFTSDPMGNLNRDPFRSYVITQPGSVLDTSKPVGEVTEFCKSQKQLIATTYNLRDLRLVGIVSRGARKYALFQDTRDYGHVVHRGDCLGREKARVKEIAPGLVTLEIVTEQGSNPPVRSTEEKSIALYPNELTLEDLQNGGENIENQPAITPPVTPPSGPTTGPVMPTDPVPPPAPAPAPTTP
jgi:hypothetical protein